LERTFWPAVFERLFSRAVERIADEDKSVHVSRLGQRDRLLCQLLAPLRPASSGR
jgi:hypothetical protein